MQPQTESDSKRISSSISVSSESREPGSERQRDARPFRRSRQKTDARASSPGSFAPPRLLPFLLVLTLFLGVGGYLLADPPHSEQAPAHFQRTQSVTPPGVSEPAPEPLRNPPASPTIESRAAFSGIDLSRTLLTMLLVLVLILVHAFLATAEIALFTVRRVRLRQLDEEGNRRASLALRLLESPGRITATTQTGIALVSTFAIMLAAVAGARPVQIWLLVNTTGGIDPLTLPLALLIVLLPVALLTLIVGGITPKSLAAHHAERWTLVSAYPVYWLQLVLAPAVGFVTALSNLVLRPFGGTASFLTPAVNEEELKLMVEAGQEQGVLEAGETEMIQSVLTLSDTVVRKVMTPRIEMTGVDADANLTELVRHVNQSGHTRIPVFEGDLDNIVGIVHAKDLLALPDDTNRDTTSVRTLTRPAYFIPETKKVNELLAEFRHNKFHMAIVRDEYGTTAGLVTMEDLIEEIVGDIQDEYDVEERLVQVLDHRTTLLNGKIALDDVNERMGLELPEDQADTIGGFVFNLLGHRAMPGERTEWEDITFVVEATDGRRITRVRMVRDTAEETDLSSAPFAEARG